MSKEFKSTEEALIFRSGKMVKENVELEQCVRQLKDDLYEVTRQTQGQEKRKDEDPARQTLGQMRQMSDLCNKLEAENGQLKAYAEAVDSFMKDKELYMPKGILCPYVQEAFGVASTICLECDSCLRVIEGYGVVCRQLLNGAKVGFVKPCPPHQSNS